jgi:hypothetical protein
MRLSEYKQRLAQVKKDLEVEHARIMLALANDAIATIAKRVVNTGKNADGEDFGKYSTKPMLVGSKAFRNKKGANKIFGSKAKRRELEWVTINRKGKNYRLAVLKGGYKQLRELSELQTEHIDFTFTSRLWKSIAVVEHSKTRALIAPKSDDRKKILGYLTEKYGRILYLSDSEWAEIQEKYDLRIIQIFRQRGL